MDSLIAGQRSALLDSIRRHPELTLAEIWAMRGEMGQLARSLTLAELRRTSDTPPPRSAATQVRTRRKTSRRDYDERVLQFLLAAGTPVGAGGIRQQVGGSATQLRAAVARLIAADEVRQSGRTRDRVYAAVGRKSARVSPGATARK